MREDRVGQRSLPELTPVQALGRGAVAGLAATLLLSALSRVLPGLWNEEPPRSSDKRELPEDPFDTEQVREWQARAQSPATQRHDTTGFTSKERHPGPPAVMPAGALSQPRAPGPEALAEQFAFKVASGVFSRDISAHVHPIGLGTHLAYGSAWGALYGLLRASYRLQPRLSGPLYGMLVYGIGPAFLVPAMKLLRPLKEEPRERTALLIAGHLVYGSAVAGLFETLADPERPAGGSEPTPVRERR